MCHTGKPMGIKITPAVTPLVARYVSVLGLSQKELGEKFDLSLRTAHRWTRGESLPDLGQVMRMAREVFPRDSVLAAALAEEAGTTLEALGLTAPAPPAALAAPVVVVAPQGPPPREFPPIELLVDSIVLAAMDVAPSDGSATWRTLVPTMLRAAFTRARGLGVSIVEVDDAFGARMK